MATRRNRIDVHVGRRVRELRHARGLSRSQLAEFLGVTVARLIAYEAGEARIGAGHLKTLSVALDVPVGAFYEGIHAEHSERFSRLH